MFVCDEGHLLNLVVVKNEKEHCFVCGAEIVRQIGGRETQLVATGDDGPEEGGLVSADVLPFEPTSDPRHLPGGDEGPDLGWGA